MNLKTTLLGALVSLSALSMALPPGPQDFTGKKLPAFSVTTIKGKKFTNSNLTGKVVLMDFWATWCGPCTHASPVMQAMHTKYGKKGLLVVGANVWDRNPKKDASDYSKKHNYTYTFTFGNEELAKSLRITGIPTMLIIDKKGVIKVVLIGYGPSLQDQLEKAVKPLL